MRWQLKAKGAAVSLKVGVIGLGEVGLKFAALIASTGATVLGVDISEKRRSTAISGLLDAGYNFTIPNLQVNDHPESCDVQVICVDSPVDPLTHRAQLENMRKATESVAKKLRSGDLVIVRSTVPVGTTRSLIDPLLAAGSGLSPTKYRLVFAPERTTTGGTLTESRAIRHLVGGRDNESLEYAIQLMERAGMLCVAMESLEAAELGKLATNATRDINQAIANQICAIASKHNLDISRLVDEVNLDYPRDRLKHASPGVGGSCLTKDSYILAQALEPTPPEETIFGIARQVNDSSQEITIDSLNRHFQQRRHRGDVRILLCGAAFKGHPPTTDTRNSVSLLTGKTLKDYGYIVEVFDPVVNDRCIQEHGFSPIARPFGANWDAILLYSNHRFFSSADNARLVLDCIPDGGFIYDPHRWLVSILNSNKRNVVYRTLSTALILHG